MTLEIERNHYYWGDERIATEGAEGCTAESMADCIASQLQERLVGTDEAVVRNDYGEHAVIVSVRLEPIGPDGKRKCPVCNGSGCTERMEVVCTRPVKVVQPVSGPCSNCGGEGRIRVRV